MKAFFYALAIMFQLEGGWTEIDGGTNMGIRASTLTSANQLGIVRTQNIRQLKRREAALIYYKMYWLESGADKYPYPLDLAIFNAAVHMGPGKAKELLRTSIRKAQSRNARIVAQRYVLESYKYLRSLKKFPQYKNGWTRRMRIITSYVVQR